jgi:hypothetical protein
MKTKLGRITIPLLVLLVLALSVVVVATSIAPSTAQARTRLENTSPLAGDPDVTDSANSGPTKAASILRPTSSNSASKTDLGTMRRLHYVLSAIFANIRLSIRA